MIRMNREIPSRRSFSPLKEDDPAFAAEEEHRRGEASVAKSHYGWLSLGGALLGIGVLLLILYFRGGGDLPAMAAFSCLSLLASLFFFLAPYLANLHRACSTPLIEKMGRELYDDFRFLEGDASLDAVIRSAFGSTFSSSLLEKKEYEALRGRKGEISFSCYDFSAKREALSGLRRLEGTLFQLGFSTGLDRASQVCSRELEDLFEALPKLPVGPGDLTCFGEGREGVEKNLDLSKVQAMGFPFCACASPAGVSILLLGKTYDVRRIRRGPLTQSRYASLSKNFAPLEIVLDSLRPRDR